MVGFLGGTLLPETRSSVEEHLAVCSACADLVTWAAADQASGTVPQPGREGRPFVGQLQPGARVGRYQVLGAVGRGGMGEVYAAYHPDLDRRIALKVVQGLDGGTGERRMRLLREARAIARLSHPNVVTVHDAGTFGDRVFIAMELINGQTIDQWLRDEPRPWQDILDVFMAAGRGLAAAHAADVVHRDFKPQNVMIARDGAVRVMDFGLARLADGDVAPIREVDEDAPTLPIENVTKTGALVGTPAYMSPEQFRREAIDARSDQFSFTVALYEALFGVRPAAASPDASSPDGDGPSKPRRPSVPGWLREIVLRGAAAGREERYSSMGALLAALERGRTRTRRRISVAAVGLAVLVVSAGAWRIARGNRFACSVPEDRVAAAWASNATDPRRQSIHGAFVASGRATAGTSWERVSAALDTYMSAWSAMYVHTCEATHIRGEQSAEVLDLRMSCLNDNLDQVRALTNAFVEASGDVISHAVTAVRDLTPVNRCADVALLKMAVPLPRDERILREVQRLRPLLAEIQALTLVGKFRPALERSAAVRPEVQATGFKPLLAELLFLTGNAEAVLAVNTDRAESILREALATAEASRDDFTAARAASSLTFLVGFRLGRRQEADLLAQLSHAILDRIGGGQERIRGWVLNSQASTRMRAGNYEEARALLERCVLIQEQSLGATHPELVMCLSNLSYALTLCGRPTEGLIAAKRASEIQIAHGDPDGVNLAFVHCNRGDALNALDQYSEAEQAYTDSLRIFHKNVGPMHPELAFALHGLGESKLARKTPAAAIRFFEDALRIRQQPNADPAHKADTEFGLARALWESGRGRTHARALATKALTAYRDGRRTERQRTVEAWLVDHAARRR